MASPDFLDQVDGPSDNLDPHRDIAGKRNVGRVDVKRGSAKDDTGVLNADVPGDDEVGDGGAKLNDGYGSAKDDAGVLNRMLL